MIKDELKSSSLPDLGRSEIIKASPSASSRVRDQLATDCYQTWLKSETGPETRAGRQVLQACLPAGPVSLQQVSVPCLVS